jgi:hypothetical protein
MAESAPGHPAETAWRIERGGGRVVPQPDPRHANRPRHCSEDVLGKWDKCPGFEERLRPTNVRGRLRPCRSWQDFVQSMGR